MYRIVSGSESAMEWEIDPRNPGEVFACAGLAHLAWRANPKSKTGFEPNDQVRFVAPDLSSLLDNLAAASLEDTEDGLRFAGIELDWWREWGLNPGLKTWAGQQSELTVHESLCVAAEGSRASDWLVHAAPATGRLYFDTKGTWNALNMGWSLNKHTEAAMLIRPWVELLASIGLQAFPVEGERSKNGFKYSLWCPASLPSAVAAFGGHGPAVYSTNRYCSLTAKSGSNTMLCLGTPV